LPQDIIQDRPGHKARAPRFPIHTPVRYRETGAMHWLEGKSLNISRTGILFRAEQDLRLSSMLELNVMLPSEMTLSCWGPIVRKESAAVPESRPALAVNFLDYRLLHEPAPQI